MGNASKRMRRGVLVAAAALAMSVAGGSVWADTTSTWTGAVSTAWSNAGNWSPSTNDPNNGNGGVNYNVIIGAPSPTVLDIGVTIDALTVNAGGNLQTAAGTTLSVNGPTLVDNGTITININQGNAQTGLSFLANTTISGTGTVVLTDSGNPNNARMDTGVGVVVTQASGHSITGNGEINAALVNNGTVNANSNVGSAALLLQSSSMTNNNLFEATGNGTLNISGITVTQVGGQILASIGTVNLINAAVTGGTLNTSGGGVIQAQGSSSIGSLTTNGTLNVVAGATLTANGDIVDNGVITVNSGAGNAQTVLNFSGGNLTGNGTMALNDSGNLNNARLDGTLTQASTHTIVGHGTINAALTNNGVVNANTNVGSGELLLQGNATTNNNLFEATNNGALVVNGIAVTQGVSGQILASGGTVTLTNASVVNGTLNTSGGGVIQVVGASAITTLTNNGTLNILAGQTLNANGNIVDNGTINVNSTAGNAQTILSFAGGVLSGTGTVVLADNTNPNNSRLDGVLTQASGHSIVGRGTINAALTNNGVVNANSDSTAGGSAQILLQTNNMTNNNIFEATAGGSLTLSGITVTQGASGTISATNATVNITNSAVVNGLLSTTGSGVIAINGGSTVSNVSSNAALNVSGGSGLTVNGNLLNTGTITVNSTAANAQTILNFSGGVVSGTGSIVLNDNGNANNARLDGSLTTSATQNITGHGNINASVINGGIINANVAGGVLNVLGTSVSNNNLIEATNGGTVVFANGVAVTNTGALISAASGGVVFNAGASVTGGTLTSTAGNVLTVNSATFTNLTLSTGTVVDIAGGGLLNMNGPTLTDNGTIVVNTTEANAQTSFSVTSNLTLAGTGTLMLNDNGSPNAARLDIAANTTLTQASGHTIDGHGNINGGFINNGTVAADVALNTLNLNGSVANNNLLEATLGTLSLNGITITQAAGAHVSAVTGTVVLNSSTIANGTVSSSGGGVFQINGSSAFTGVTSNATVNINPNQVLTVNGNLVNNGTITINLTEANAQTSLTVVSGTVSGTGTIFLNDNGAGNAARLDGTVTTTSGQLIDGHGNINAVITNGGTINSNTANGTINFNGAVTNNSVIEATLGAVALNSVTVTQGAGGQVNAATSPVVVNSSGIVGGVLNGTGGGAFQIVGSSAYTSLTSNAPVNIGGGQSLTTNGVVVDNGLITVNTTQVNAQTSLTVNGTISGSGTIFLNDNGNGNAARLDGTLIQGAGHTVTGHGNINATITNNGAVVSNITGTVININGPTTNNALIRATNGGTINFAGSAPVAGTLGSGTLQADAGSTINVSGGAFTSNTGTISLTAATSSFTGLTSLTNSGNIALASGSTLTVSGSLTGATSGVISGTGTLVAGSLFGNISTVSGTVRVAANGAASGTSKLTTLAIAGGTNAWTGDFDLTNNKVVVEDSTNHAATLGTLENQVLYGQTHATGITSSALPAHTVIAVADNSTFTTPFITFGGQPVDGSSILVAPEILGDTDFSGKVDLTDLNTVLNHLGVADQDWTFGNFDGAAKIDLTDLNDVLNNLGVTLANANAAPAAAAPEPGSLALMAAGASVLMRRRRRL